MAPPTPQTKSDPPPVLELQIAAPVIPRLSLIMSGSFDHHHFTPSIPSLARPLALLRTSRGQTALQYAAGFGRLQVCRVLMASGGIEALHACGGPGKRSPLHRAAAFGRDEVVKVVASFVLMFYAFSERLLLSNLLSLPCLLPDVLSLHASSCPS